jgi:hypothetical protein
MGWWRCPIKLEQPDNKPIWPQGGCRTPDRKLRMDRLIFVCTCWKVLARTLGFGTKCNTCTCNHQILSFSAHIFSIFFHYYSFQNIDTLERVADIPTDKLIEAHGSFHTSHCIKCTECYTQDWIKGEDKLIEAHGSFHTSHCIKCTECYTQDWIKGEVCKTYFLIEFIINALFLAHLGEILSISRAHFVTTRSIDKMIDLKLCSNVPLDNDVTNQITV